MITVQVVGGEKEGGMARKAGIAGSRKHGSKAMAKKEL